MSRGPVKPEEVPDAEARLPPPPPADPLARGVPEVLVRDPRPARPPAREDAPHPALRAAAHRGRPAQRRPAREPRRGGALRRRGGALVGQPPGPGGGARRPRGPGGRPRAARGREALHRPRALGALARDRAADHPLLTRRRSARALDGPPERESARAGRRVWNARREPHGRLDAARVSTGRAPSGRPSARALEPADGVWGHRKRAARVAREHWTGPQLLLLRPPRPAGRLPRWCRGCRWWPSW